MNKKLLALYGLKWNPFSPQLPTEALYRTAKIDNFCWRIEQALVREGGFALISGDPGTGKSVVLRLLAERLAQLRDIQVAALVHPSANLADFYREMGDLFAVELRPHHRWGGFKALRERCVAHLERAPCRDRFSSSMRRRKWPRRDQTSCACWLAPSSIPVRCSVWCSPAMGASTPSCVVTSCCHWAVASAPACSWNTPAGMNCSTA